jgi:hypothetical protein
MSSKKNQEPQPENNPQQPDARQAEQGKANTGRASNGRFSKGNKGGPGNPFARQTATMRKAFVAEAGEEQMRAIARAMIEKASNGDVGAARLVCSYVMGRPTEAPDPDRLDEMEWQQWQRDTIGNDEVTTVLGGVSTTMACGIARNGVPAMQEEKAQIISQGFQEFEQTLQEEAADELFWETEDTPQTQAEPAAQPSAEEVPPAPARVEEQEELDRLLQNIRDAAAQAQQEQAAQEEQPIVLPITEAPAGKRGSTRRAANPPEPSGKPDRQQTGGNGPTTGQNGTVKDHGTDRPAG